MPTSYQINITIFYLDLSKQGSDSFHYIYFCLSVELGTIQIAIIFFVSTILLPE